METSIDFIVTDGQAQYKVIRPWQQPSRKVADLSEISHVALDSHDRVFVLRRSSPHVLIYSPQGALERVFDHPRLTSGHGLFISPDDRLFVGTYDSHQVLVFDHELNLLFELGAFNEPHWNEPFNHPTDVAATSDGEIYVSDGYGNARIHRFSREGKLICSWGSPGVDDGQFATPHAIWVLPDGRVLCCDRDNDRVQVFDREGKHLANWLGFVRPMDMWASADGEHIFITEQAPRITRVDGQGNIIGRARAFGVYPHGIWGDSHGSLFVAEQGCAHQVTKYERMGHD